MKKLLIGLSLVLFPFISYASDADIKASVSQSLITQFTTELAVLSQAVGQISQAQDATQFTGIMAMISQELNFISTSIATLQATTTVNNTVAPQTFGSTIQVSQSMPTLKITQTFTSRNISSDAPFGQFGWNVSVLDADGNYVKGAQVTMQAPDDANGGSATGLTLNETGSTGIGKRAILGDWNKDFMYVPTSSGTKVITFTSGNLTDSVSLEVK